MKPIDVMDQSVFYFIWIKTGVLEKIKTIMVFKNITVYQYFLILTKKLNIGYNGGKSEKKK